MGRVWRTICRPGTNFIEHYLCRYKFDRSRKFNTLPDLNCGGMRALPNVAEQSWVSGCKNHYKFVLRAGTKAKTVTNNLPLLSVLGYVVIILFLSRQIYPVLFFMQVKLGNKSKTKVMSIGRNDQKIKFYLRFQDEIFTQ